MTDDGLRITDYGLQITDYGLQITDYNPCFRFSVVIIVASSFFVLSAKSLNDVSSVATLVSV
jgi:hypothetical protein